MDDAASTHLVAQLASKHNSQTPHIASSDPPPSRPAPASSLSPPSSRRSPRPATLNSSKSSTALHINIPQTAPAGAVSQPSDASASDASGSKTRRATLNFPIAIRPSTPASAPVTAIHPASATTKQSPQIISHVRKPTATSESNFLTALAGQERFVLELKEELAKAEQELAKLKSQWVSHESQKRRSESKRIHKLQPINTGSSRVPLDLITSPRTRDAYEQLVQRKARLDSLGTPSRRRKFSPSRHARSLSLVSPDTIRRHAEVVRQAAATTTEPDQPRGDSPTLSQQPFPWTENDDRASLVLPDPAMRPVRDQQRDRIVRQSMQMASELREGLWTFWEDLRNATYGDEAKLVSAPPQEQSSPPTALQTKNDTNKATTQKSQQRRKPMVRRQTWQFKPKTSSRRTVDVSEIDEDDFWKDFGMKEPEEGGPPPGVVSLKSASEASPRVELITKEVDGESWDTWESPSRTPSSRSDSTQSQTSRKTISSHSSVDTTPRASKASGKTATNDTPPSKDAPLPWPSLTKLRPDHLRRTASNLMDEWEKSLNPPETRKGETTETAKGGPPKKVILT